MKTVVNRKWNVSRRNIVNRSRKKLRILEKVEIDTNRKRIKKGIHFINRRRNKKRSRNSNMVSKKSRVVVEKGVDTLL